MAEDNGNQDEAEAQTPQSSQTPPSTDQTVDPGVVEPPQSSAQQHPPGPDKPSTPNTQATWGAYKDDEQGGGEDLTIEDLRNVRLSLLNADMADVESYSAHWPRIDDDDDLATNIWSAAFYEGFSNLLKGGTLSDSVKRAESMWVQRVEHEGHPIAPGRPRRPLQPDSEISGERAIMEIVDAMGTGSMVQIPLWHTGIWVTIKPAQEIELLELDRRMGTEKITLGRYTNGMIFSNTSVYTASTLADFVLDHVYDSTSRDIRPESLKNLIKINDLPTLIWGLACAVYPTGYPHARPCTVDPAKCQHVVTATLDIAKLFWVDRDSLTDWQKRFMTNRTDKVKTEDLERYEQEHVRGGSRRVEVHDDISIELARPTIGEYERTGKAWVDGLVRRTEESLGSRLDGQMRNNYLIEQGQLTALCQYGHWVKKIWVRNRLIQDRNTIDRSLASLSSDENIRDKFFEQIGKFIDDSTLAVIAIPRYSCPNCGEPQEADMFDEWHPLLLPIDVVRAFFTLLGQRTTRASSRTNSGV